MPCSPPELRVTQENCDLTEMNVPPYGRMVPIKEIELLYRERVTQLINLILQNNCALSPSKECRRENKEANSLTLKLILSGPYVRGDPRTDCPLRSPGMAPVIWIECPCLGHNRMSPTL